MNPLLLSIRNNESSTNTIKKDLQLLYKLGDSIDQKSALRQFNALQRVLYTSVRF